MSKSNGFFSRFRGVFKKSESKPKEKTLTRNELLSVVRAPSPVIQEESRKIKSYCIETAEVGGINKCIVRNVVARVDKKKCDKKGNGGVEQGASGDDLWFTDECLTPQKRSAVIGTFLVKTESFKPNDLRLKEDDLQVKFRNNFHNVDAFKRDELG